MQWLPGNSTVVGLALTEREIIAVQMIRAGKQSRVTAITRVAWDMSADEEDAETLGKRLRSALRESGIMGRRTVIGLPARWIMARMQATPPIQGPALSQTLQLMADRLFSADSSDLAMDYVPPIAAAARDIAPGSDESVASRKAADSEEGSQQVLLLATARRRMWQVLDVAAAAGLKVDAVTPTVLALASATQVERDRCVAICRDDAVDLIFVKQGTIAMLRHVAIPGGSRQADVAGNTEDSADSRETAIAAAMQRVLVAEQPQGLGAYPIQLWGDPEAIAIMKKALRTMSSKVSAMAPADEMAWTPEASRAVDDANLPWVGGAMALAWTAAGPQRQLADLAHSKLTPPSPRRFSKPWRIAALAAVAALMFVGLLYMQLIDAQRQHDDLAFQLATMRDDVESAETLLDQLGYVEHWFADRPMPLEYLWEMTLAFPERGVIWSTEVTLRDETTASITGGAEESRHVLELRDRLEASSLLENVTLQYLREAGRQRNEVSFSMSMTLRKPTRQLMTSESSGAIANGDQAVKGAEQ